MEDRRRKRGRGKKGKIRKVEDPRRGRRIKLSLNADSPDHTHSPPFRVFLRLQGTLCS